jgi:hypothetical protein
MTLLIALASSYREVTLQAPPNVEFFSGGYG